MVKFKITKKPNYTSHYLKGADTITIGKRGLDNLNDSESIEYLSDTILHEYMHKLMHEIFNNSTVSTLFDTIEKHFRDMCLLEKSISDNDRDLHGIMTHTQYLEEIGIEAYKNSHYISNTEFLKAVTICNRRLI